MSQLLLNGRSVGCRSAETVLDALLRAGVPIDFSCRSGVCRRCMLRCVEGSVPQRARARLPQALQDAGCLLACQCTPQGDMVLAAAPGQCDPLPSPLDEEAPAPPPDPALWAELGQGRQVRAVLVRFYAKVYADSLLRPFFERVTMERAIGKQYAFLMQGITGQAVYLGERPRNAHHWMVIPASLFEHRQALMRSAQRELGLGDALIERWARFEDAHRADIVKAAPWPKRVGERVIDTECFEAVVLDEATVCDHCEAAIDRGTEVRYHRRLGRLACGACAPAMALRQDTP